MGTTVSFAVQPACWARGLSAYTARTASSKVGRGLLALCFRSVMHLLTLFWPVMKVPGAQVMSVEETKRRIGTFINSVAAETLQPCGVSLSPTPRDLSPFPTLGG